eukprot:2043330-Alexandrium_andersonii.AAC.1
MQSGMRHGSARVACWGTAWSGDSGAAGRDSYLSQSRSPSQFAQACLEPVSGVAEPARAQAFPSLLRAR